VHSVMDTMPTKANAITMTIAPVMAGGVRPSFLTVVGADGCIATLKPQQRLLVEPLLRVHRVRLNLKCSYSSRHSRRSHMALLAIAGAIVSRETDPIKYDDCHSLASEILAMRT
jgi:hypothetical protein